MREEIESQFVSPGWSLRMHLDQCRITWYNSACRGSMFHLQFAISCTPITNVCSHLSMDLHGVQIGFGFLLGYHRVVPRQQSSST